MTAEATIGLKILKHCLLKGSPSRPTQQMLLKKSKTQAVTTRADLLNQH